MQGEYIITAEICIYMILSSRQLKMEEHKAKPFSHNFIKSLEFLKRNLESLILLSVPYFLCPFNHSFQKSDCNPSLDFIVSSPFTTPNSIKSFHCTQLQLSPQGFLTDRKRGSRQTFFTDIFYVTD